MSHTDKLLSNINEYQNLLGFLNERHPAILDEWKNNSNGAVNATTNTTDDTVTNPKDQSGYDYRDRIRE